MTLAGLLQSKLVSMDVLSPQANQEILPLGSEMQVATVAVLGKMFECFLVPRDYPLLLINSQAMITCMKFGIVFPVRSIKLLAPIACVQKSCE